MEIKKTNVVDKKQTKRRFPINVNNYSQNTPQSTKTCATQKTTLVRRKGK